MFVHSFIERLDHEWVILIDKIFPSKKKFFESKLVINSPNEYINEYINEYNFTKLSFLIMNGS